MKRDHFLPMLNQLKHLKASSISQAALLSWGPQSLPQTWKRLEGVSLGAKLPASLNLLASTSASADKGDAFA